MLYFKSYTRKDRLGSKSKRSFQCFSEALDPSVQEDYTVDGLLYSTQFSLGHRKFSRGKTAATFTQAKVLTPVGQNLALLVFKQTKL